MTVYIFRCLRLHQIRLDTPPGGWRTHCDTAMGAGLASCINEHSHVRLRSFEFKTTLALVGGQTLGWRTTLHMGNRIDKWPRDVLHRSLHISRVQN